MTAPRIPDDILRLKGEAAYEVLARAQALEREGKSIIHMEIGQPDFKTPQPVVDAAVVSLQRGDHGYAPTLGVWELRQAIAHAENEKRGTSSIDPSCVAVMPGAKTSIFVGMAAVLERGDEVIYPDPGFPTYGNVCEYLGSVARPLPMVEKNGFSFDREAFEKLVSPKTKLIILNSPSNPTGGTIPEADLQFVAKMALKYNAWVMTDEIYEALVFTGARVPSIYDIPHMPERTLVVNGFSKTFAMTGWRLGYLVAPTPLMGVIDNFSVNLFACAATSTQYAGIAALALQGGEVERMRKEYDMRRRFLVEALRDIPGVTCVEPQGAFYVFPNISSFGRSAAEIAEIMLTQFGVAMLPGTAFGSYGEGYLRLSYATSIEHITEAIVRLKKGFTSLQV